jgi:DNA repair photolyase
MKQALNHSDRDAWSHFAPGLLGGSFVPAELRRGRASVSNSAGRFEPVSRERLLFDDEEPINLRTEVIDEAARSIITRNDSPDLHFDRTINPYRGCEHGCIYCFARPSHAYQGLSPGLDFETKIFAKPNAAALLRKELSAPGYKPSTIALGANTDPYQPLEKSRKLTRALLEVLEEFQHPVGIVTKGAMVLRDLDILQRMASQGLVKVAMSVTTMDAKLARKMEPRASSPALRLDAVRQLSAAGVPVSVLVAPIIPALNDHEIEQILEAGAAAGASEAGYVLLRLPLEIKDLFREWLVENEPDRARRVLSILRSMRGGKDYDANFGTRMKGEGPYAWMIGRRFEMACERLGLGKRKLKLRTDLFKPVKGSQASQLSLF